ncbi:MAG: DUF6482 family protein [Oleiphilaceae bacterium]|nr:DUF6482 family protein [Oleiphilaceae bacterium]
MKISYEELGQLEPIEKVIIQSVDLSLYRVMIEHQGETYYLVDGSKIQTYRSLQAAKTALSLLQITKLVLQHTSAYDEMIGHPEKGSNLMEIKLEHLHFDTQSRAN